MSLQSYFSVSQIPNDTSYTHFQRKKEHGRPDWQLTKIESVGGYLVPAMGIKMFDLVETGTSARLKEVH